jgi:hypothetical protein
MDVQRVIDTRLVLPANSGAGKSWAIRKMVEETYGQAQIIIIDVEGEFRTLREKYDFIIAGKNDSDVSIDPAHAKALCHKVLEEDVDIICDLYDLAPHDRVRWVKNFCEALLDAPKKFWHPALIFLDEAHKFAPEKDSAESASAVINLASQGRKRGFCLVAATQRLAKLDKDVAAECQNKLIGLCNIGIDRKRAAEELGFYERAEILSLRDLSFGHFYAVGPAFDRGVNLVQIGKVKTHHPTSGSQRLNIRTPKPTAKMKAVLAKLTAIPKEVEKEENLLVDAMRRVKDLQAQLRARPKAVVMPPLPALRHVVDPKLLKTVDRKGQHLGAERMLGQMMANGQFFRDDVVKALNKFIKACQKKLPPVPDLSIMRSEWPSPTPGFKVAPFTMPSAGPIGKLQIKSIKTLHPPKPGSRKPVEVDTLGKQERDILAVLNTNPDGFFTKTQVAARSRYSKKSSGFANAISKLNTCGLIEKRGSQELRVLPGVDVSHLVGDAPKTLADWLPKLGACERAILTFLLAGRPGLAWTKETIAVNTKKPDGSPYSVGSSGFINSISHLSSLGLIVRTNGQIAVNPELL